MPNFSLIIPVNLKPKPDLREQTVAQLCAQYFQSDIKFVLRGNTTTPDIFVARTGEFWEIKNIRGCGRHAIGYNLHDSGELKKLSEINEAALIDAQTDDIVNQLRNLFNVQL